MAPPEANIEMVVMARNLPNDCIGSSIPGGAARDETVIAILLSKYQPGKIAEVHRQDPTITPGVRLRRMCAIPWRAKPRGELSMGSNIVTSLAPGETL
jgi:hypothetical protein